MNLKRVIVIGGSAGSLEPLQTIVAQLPGDLDAAVAVVVHGPPEGPTLLAGILERAGGLSVQIAKPSMPLVRGAAYVAPRDHHLLIAPGRLVVTRGPKENGFRPAIDPLFRTAARSYSNRAIGVVLSGYLDDGTLGLMRIKKRGGVAIVQDPAEAKYPSMPHSAARYVSVDYVLPVSEIAPLLAQLVAQPLEEGPSMSLEQHDVTEFGAHGLIDDRPSGPPSVFTCPDCGGALWEIIEGELVRYRCHVGHGYTAQALMVGHDRTLDEALWTALRTLEEAAEMRRKLSERAQGRGDTILADRFHQQAQNYEGRAEQVRRTLLAG